MLICGVLPLFWQDVASITTLCWWMIFFRFTWIFALTNKKDALKYLIVFQRLVENQLDQKIKVFQSDHDGEFWALFLITYVGA